MTPHIPWPRFLPRASALYSYPYLYRRPLPEPLPYPIEEPIPIPVPEPIEPGEIEPSGGEAAYPYPYRGGRSEELRLDVDGSFPQMTVSGRVVMGLTEALHWIANLTRVSRDSWEGDIWFKNGNPAYLPYNHVTVEVTRSFYAYQRRAKVTFSGGMIRSVTRTYAWQSWYFHKADFEFDTVEGTTAVTAIDTHDHPDRPAGMTSENLSIEDIYRRAGFDVSISGGSGNVPISLANADGVWSDAEMHDAMVAYWSRFQPKAQWAMWVLFAARHQMGTNLGGIMFDDIGPNHRQGTAMFNDSFIANPPNGDPAPAAWVQRMRFWTAVHEMGHAFNLAHSWQKSLGTPWIFRRASTRMLGVHVSHASSLPPSLRHRVDGSSRRRRLRLRGRGGAAAQRRHHLRR